MNIHTEVYAHAIFAIMHDKLLLFLVFFSTAFFILF